MGSQFHRTQSLTVGCGDEGAGGKAVGWSATWTLKSPVTVKGSAVKQRPAFFLSFISEIFEHLTTLLESTRYKYVKGLVSTFDNSNHHKYSVEITVAFPLVFSVARMKFALYALKSSQHLCYKMQCFFSYSFRFMLKKETLQEIVACEVSFLGQMALMACDYYVLKFLLLHHFIFEIISNSKWPSLRPLFKDFPTELPQF